MKFSHWFADEVPAGENAGFAGVEVGVGGGGAAAWAALADAACAAAAAAASDLIIFSTSSIQAGAFG